MRIRRFVFATHALLALAACGHKSKLDLDRSASVDELWDLAPDGTELGIVASPRAVGLAFRALAAVREASAQPDLGPAKEELDQLSQAMFGSSTATPEDAGFASDRAFAMFATKDEPRGVIGVMPVGDRDKFMAAKKGTRGSAEDTLEQNHCREIKGRYICATNVALFDHIGKGSMRGKLAAAGARGDAELFIAGVPLFGDTGGDLAISAQLEQGELAIHGAWTGTPSGVLAKLVGLSAPTPSTNGASGFVSLDVTPLLAAAPAIPIAGGITLDQLAASLVGPVTITIPSGTIDIQLQAPLKDPKPATTIVENCKDVGSFFALAKDQPVGACRIVLQGTNALELDIWVEGSTLRVGAHKGPTPAGKAGALTQVGRELGAGSWTGVLWGRGTMINLSGIKPAEQEVPDEVAFGIHAMALVNELGAAIKVGQTGITFRGYLRTAWANPTDVIARYTAIPGKDILSGKATDTGKQLAASAPSSPFAADFAAGQGGLMIPAAAIGLATSIVLPALMHYINGDGDSAAPEENPDAGQPNEPPMGNSELVTLLVHAYVEEAFPKWQADHKGTKCPEKLDDLAKYFGDDPGIPVMDDPWGHKLVMKCDDKGVSVMSMGEDGKAGTPDDVHAP